MTIELGTKMWLRLQGLEKKEYVGAVVDEDQENIWIMIDKELMKYVEEKTCILSFREYSGALQTFTAEHTAVRKEGNVWMAGFRKPAPEHIHRIQRRNFLRVEAKLNVAVYGMEEDDLEPFVTTTYDVSGGGVSIWMPRGTELVREQQVLLYISLPLKKEEKPTLIKTLFNPLRHTQVEGGNERWGGEFLDISEQDRKKLVRYTMFEHARKARA
ncbi:hypothetical protein G4V62_01435 [Bacillaceae bacterium SIJ1]|uniref:flagellar brake protein n=1 Tax=Litoribacterium kuwaitense TaxID=1398745 RepID=UPI0013E9BDE6|nr:PilZ domain-containing protein [Litoribacterium kuwaitense]NGP43689.1 hypothetical protein [Litoribacterium kuwaitense]